MFTVSLERECAAPLCFEFYNELQLRVWLSDYNFKLRLFHSICIRTSFSAAAGSCFQRSVKRLLCTLGSVCEVKNTYTFKC